MTSGYLFGIFKLVLDVDDFNNKQYLEDAHVLGNFRYSWVSWEPNLYEEPFTNY